MFRVLIVDDDWIIRRQLRKMKAWSRAKEFFIAGEASDGLDALEKLEAGSFDMVLTDIRMPKVDGVELLTEVVEHKLAPCVVFLSEHTEFSYAKMGIVHGAFDYLVKPVAEEDLERLLHRAGQFLKCLNGSEKCAQTTEDIILLPIGEINVLKQCVRGIDLNSCGTSGIVAEKVLTAFMQDVIRAETVLENILQELLAILIEQATWVGKFVDLRQITLRGTERTQEPKHLIAAFSRLVSIIVDWSNQFSCIEGNGPLVRKISRYVLDNVDCDISAKDIASSLFINRCYVSQIFRKKTGMTLGDYAIGLKMERAKNLLRHSDMEVREIASTLGYKDAEYFSRLFKKHTTYSPTAYRRSQGYSPDSVAKNFRG